MLTERLKEYDIILGSASPRRRDLLAELGIEFGVVDPAIDEMCPDSIPPAETAQYLAGKKADMLGTGLGSAQILITADTIVLCDNQILGKPATREEAIDFLRRLSGREHSVITGVCISSATRRSCFSTETLVTFCSLGDDEIEYYVDNFKPYDKAGGYGIQEWIGYVATEKIEGSYFNVMGLPVNRLYRELKEFIK
ncbi:MAG: septum formation protein Maf [Bacteroidales bacterium]|nr:septum formation protein Maf [Bacteroidales bacterium]